MQNWIARFLAPLSLCFGALAFAEDGPSTKEDCEKEWVAYSREYNAAMDLHDSGWALIGSDPEEATKQLSRSKMVASEYRDFTGCSGITGLTPDYLKGFEEGRQVTIRSLDCGIQSALLGYEYAELQEKVDRFNAGDLSAAEIVVQSEQVLEASGVVEYGAACQDNASAVEYAFDIRIWAMSTRDSAADQLE